jgi:hypothetical protein
VNRYNGPPAPLGSTAAAQARLIVWCRDCRHEVEPDPAEMAARRAKEGDRKLVGTPLPVKSKRRVRLQIELQLPRIAL